MYVCTFGCYIIHDLHHSLGFDNKDIILIKTLLFIFLTNALGILKDKIFERQKDKQTNKITTNVMNLAIDCA